MLEQWPMWPMLLSWFLSACQSCQWFIDCVPKNGCVCWFNVLSVHAIPYRTPKIPNMPSSRQPPGHEEWRVWKLMAIFLKDYSTQQWHVITNDCKCINYCSFLKRRYRCRNSIKWCLDWLDLLSTTPGLWNIFCTVPDQGRLGPTLSSSDLPTTWTKDFCQDACCHIILLDCTCNATHCLSRSLLRGWKLR